MSDQSINNLIGVLSVNAEKFKFPLAMLLTSSNIHVYSNEVLERIKPIFNRTELRITPMYENWLICSDGEKRLLNAIDDGAIIVVNNSLVVKYIGKFSALCTQTFATNSGYVFLEGCWYSPKDKSTIDILNDAFDESIGEIDLESGEWVFMKVCEEANGLTPDQVVGRARYAIDRFKKGLVPKYIRGVPRSEYRRETQEYN